MPGNLYDKSKNTRDRRIFGQFLCSEWPHPGRNLRNRAPSQLRSMPRQIAYPNDFEAITTANLWAASSRPIHTPVRGLPVAMKERVCDTVDGYLEPDSHSCRTPANIWGITESGSQQFAQSVTFRSDIRTLIQIDGGTR